MLLVLLGVALGALWALLHAMPDAMGTTASSAKHLTQWVLHGGALGAIIALG